jgi:hypothetical protein
MHWPVRALAHSVAGLAGVDKNFEASASFILFLINVFIGSH